MKIYYWTASAVVVALAAGCSTQPQMDYSGVDLIPVSGTVTLDGEPLAGAVITFDNTEDGTFSFARTDDSGFYELKFDTVVDGVTPGFKRVQVSTSRTLVGLDPVGGEEDTGEGEGEGEGEVGEESDETRAEELVPPRYNKESELFVDVSADETQFDFDLTSGEPEATASL